MKTTFFDLNFKSVSDCYLFTCRAHPPVKSRGRHTNALLFCLSGENRFVYDGESFILKAGGFAYLPKGVGYSVERLSQTEIFVVDFESFESDLPPQAFADCSANFRSVEQNLKKACDAFGKNDVLKLKSYLYRTVSDVKAAYSNYLSPESKRLVAPALDYVAANFSGDVTNAVLAGLCGISERYLSKLFVSAVGVSVKQYVLSLRIERSKNLLRDPTIPIDEVAVNCGFENRYYFTKLFRQKTGVSPARYRKASRT